jgi:hypothetical protein
MFSCVGRIVWTGTALGSVKSGICMDELLEASC